MPVFRYEAIDAGQHKQSGTLVSDSPRQAREQLRSNGLQVRQLSEDDRTSNSGTAWWRFRVRYPHKVGMLIRELATLTHAGIPLSDALATLIRQHHGVVQFWVMRLRDRVEQGMSLADAMEEQPGAFDPLAVHMVRVGENAGNLEEVLTILADFSEKSLSFRNRLLSALLYPTLVFISAIGVSIFLMTSVVPQLLSGLIEAGRPLPLPTRILKFCSDGLVSYGWLAGLAAVIILVSTVAYLSTPSGQIFGHRLQLKLPLIGSLAFRQTMSRSAYVIATLLRSGLDLTQSFTIAADSCQNRVVAAGLRNVESAVTSGRDLGPAFEQSSVFPPLVVQIFSVGQQSGQLEQMLERLSRDYEHQVETLSGRLATILEPITILFLTAVVGFILLATVLPILEAGNAL